MTDREKAGLRGSVKACVEEIVHSIGTSSVTSEYSLDGKLVTCRHMCPDSSVWVTTYEHDADGHLMKIVSGKVGDPSSATLYTYDEDGELTETSDVDGRVIHTSYHSDQQGRKILFALPVWKDARSGGAGDVQLGTFAFEASVSKAVISAGAFARVRVLLRGQGGLEAHNTLVACFVVGRNLSL